MKKKLKLEDKLLMENYFINNPLKFYINPKILRDFFVAGIEILKILLAKVGLLKMSYNERLLERPFVFQNLPEKRGASVLDFGCSDSIMPIEMAALGYNTYGSDLKKYPYTHPNFKFLGGDIMNIDIKDNSLDCITCISVIEHVGLEKDYAGIKNKYKRKDKLAMEKMYALLKPKGTLILTTLFGTSRVLKNRHTRIYDSHELKWLCSDFKIKKQRYFFSKNKDWVESTPEALEKMTVKKPIDTVVLLVLEKN